MIFHLLILALLLLDTTQAITKRYETIHHYSDAASEVWNRSWQKLILSSKSRSIPSNNIIYRRGSTRVGKIAIAFSNVAVTGRLSRGSSIIRTLDLMQACKVFAKAMREIGQGSVARDLEKNVRKVNKVYKSAPRDIRNSLRSLLEYEKKCYVLRHDNGGLKDPSAAMGGLWILRSLSFQSDLYSGILREGRKPSDAALAAYARQLEPFHGRGFRRLYKFSLKRFSPPSQREALRSMGGFPDNSFGVTDEQATRRDIEYILSIWNPLLQSGKSLYRDLDLEDNRRV